MSLETTRRAMLKQLSLGAGGTLLAPFLTRLAAEAAGDAKSAHPKRIVFVLQTNGMNPAHLVPVGVKRRADGKNEAPKNDRTETIPLADKKLHRALEPLAPFQDRLTLIQGLSGRVSLGDHSCNHGALGACPGNKGPITQTIDSLLASHSPGVIPHVAIGYGGNTEAMNYSFSASAPGKAIPIICSPKLAYQALFGSVAEGQGKQAFDLKTNLLDFMSDDVKRTRDVLVGEEKEKLDRYLEAFENLRNRQAELLAKAEDLKKHAPKLGDKLTTSTSSLILEAQFENAAAALLSGLTNVVTLISGGGNQRFGSFPEFGILDLHGLGHGNAYGRTSADECFVDLRVFHTRLIAGLVKKLAEAKEGNGTMLDNTLIVYLSDSGEAHHPRLYEWPVVLIGDLGKKLKPGGRYLQLPYYQTTAHRTMANFYCTLLHAVGQPRDKFGTPDPGLKDIDQTGIIPELLA